MDNQALKTYIEKLINRGSSATELARKCGISDTAMSQFRSGKYGANEDSIAEKIASGLNYYENAWNVVESVTSYTSRYAPRSLLQRRITNGCVYLHAPAVEKLNPS